MKINENDVDYVARLARLRLSKEEKEKFSVQLESILTYVDKLNTLDTNNVPPTSHALSLKNVWRADKLEKCPEITRGRILSGAPDREDDFFKVKKVIE